MLENIRYGLILCLLAFLCSSSGYSMNEENDDDLPPVSSLPFSIDLKNKDNEFKEYKIFSESSFINGNESQINRSDIFTPKNSSFIDLSESSIASEELALSHEYFIVKYCYSHQYISDMNWYGDYKPKDYTLTPTESFDVKKWNKDKDLRYKKYRLLRKERDEALKKTDKELQRKTQAAFQSILRDALRRHDSEEIRIKVKEIEEQIEIQIRNEVRSKITFRESQEQITDEELDSIIKEVADELFYDTKNNNINKILQIREYIKEMVSLHNRPTTLELNQEFIDIDLINADLEVLFQQEITEIEKRIYNEKAKKTKKKKTNALPEKVMAFSLNKSDITPQRISWLKREIDRLGRCILIMEYAILAFNRDCVKELSSTWTTEQWEKTIHDVKKSIKSYVDKNYPFREYHVCLMGNNPSQESLKLLKPRVLGLYLKNDKMFAILKGPQGKPREIEIQDNKKKTQGINLLALGSDLFERCIKALSNPEGANLNLKDEWRLLDLASACDFLPNDYSGEEMSRLKKDRNDVLDLLYNKGSKWKFDGFSWEKPGKENVIKPNIYLHEEEQEEKDKIFFKYWKPYIINNKLFSDIVTSLNPSLEANPIVTLEDDVIIEETEKSYKVKKQYPELLNLKDLKFNEDVQLISPKNMKLNEDIEKAIKVITFEDIKAHREKKAELHHELSKRKIDDKEYNAQNIKLYNELITKYEKARKKIRELDFKLDKPHSLVVGSYGVLNYYLPNVSSIPNRRKFFASDIPYGEQEPIQTINLSQCQLSDNSFFIKTTDTLYLEKKSLKTSNFPLIGYKAIDLSENDIEGLRGPTLSENVEKIDLSHNNLSSLAIVRSLSILLDLDVSFNKIQSLVVFSNYSNRAFSLRSLNISYNDSLVDIKDISLLTNLSIVNLSGNKKLFVVNNEPFQALAKLPTLTSLKLDDCGLSGNWNTLFPISLDNLCILDVKQNDGIKFPTDKRELKTTLLPNLKELHTNNIEPITWK